MARQTDRLTARKAATVGAGLHADGGGLYLRVEPSGARRWVFIFRHNAKRCEMGLGPLADCPLAEARELAFQARRDVRLGKNPIDERRRQKAAIVALPFGELARQVVASLTPQWRNPKVAQQWLTTLTVDAAVLERVPVDQVDTERVLDVLRPIWLEKPETAARLRGRIERVLDTARVRGMRTGENPARWRGHLAILLPKRIAARKNHPSLPYARVKEFFAVLRQSESISATALDFTILTNTRTSECLGAKGTEIDLAAAVWAVPRDTILPK